MKNFKHKHLFDFSNYPKDSKFFDETYKKVIGKMEDESEGKIIGEFGGLKSKMCSMKNIDGKESNTTKGVNIATEFSEFKDTLFNKKVLRHKMRIIQGKKHDEIHTLAYFQKDLKITDKKDSHKEKRFSQMITNKNKHVQLNFI